MGDIYIDRYTSHGKCQFCGKQGPEKVVNTKRPGRQKYLKAQYGWIFKKVSWFRGEDEFIGKICVDCRKAGKLKEITAT